MRTDLGTLIATINSAYAQYRYCLDNGDTTGAIEELKALEQAAEDAAKLAGQEHYDLNEAPL